jgi:hypothetical protein
MPYSFCDGRGTPVRYTDGDQHIFGFDGAPVAFIHGGSVYRYSGEHLGWFSSGSIRDQSGDKALFSEFVEGGPMKPITMMKPMKAMKALEPMKGL